MAYDEGKSSTTSEAKVSALTYQRAGQDGARTLNSSSASDPAPVEYLDLDGAWFEGAVEKLLDLKDVWEAFHGVPLGPVILVPKSELDRWLGRGGPLRLVRDHPLMPSRCTRTTQAME